MILAPNSRLLLLDSLKPPPGFHVDAAIGTTYTLSLDALLIPPAAWAAHAVADRVDSVDPILLANTLRMFAERTLVFHQAGFASPFTVGYESLAPFLDEMMFPVVVSPGSTFHPKVWVVRFRTDSGDRGLRVLIGSRNLSLDTTWDVIVRLDSVSSGRAGVDASPLADLLASLPARSSVSLPPARRRWFDDLLADLRDTTFEPPPGVDDVGIFAWTRGNAPVDLFPVSCKHRLVLSPFLGADQLRRLPGPSKTGRSVLVSRPSSLTEDLAAGFEPYTLQTDVTDVEEGEEARLGSDLHAKVFAFDDGQSATVVLGSANATGAAFTINDEVVVRLRGDANKLGVQRILGEDVGPLDDDDDRDLDLGMLLEPWFPTEATEPDEDDGRFFEKAINAVASAGIDAECVELETELFELTLKLRARPRVPPGIGVEFSLLGQSTPLPPSFADGEAAAVTLALDAVTRIVQVRLSDRSATGVDDVTIVLVADFEPPARRHIRALRSLLTDNQRFLRFLRFLLESSRGEVYGISERDGDSQPTKRGRTRNRRLLDEEGPILEQLLRLLAQDPGELRHLKAVIDEFSDDASILPPDFRKLWNAIEPIIPAAEETLQ